MRSHEPPASSSSAAVVTLVTDEAALPALAAAWEALIDADEPGACFRSSAWLLPWWKNFSSGKELRVYCAHVGERLMGVLPAYRCRAVGGRRLRLLGDGIVGSDYLGVIARPEDRTVAAEAIARALVNQEEDAILDGLLEGDALSTALESAARRAAQAVSVEPLLPCPHLDLRAVEAMGGFDRWLKTLPNGQGAQLVRRRRWLEKQEGYSLEIITDPARAAAACDALWRLHHLRWSVEGGSDAVDGADVTEFHREAAAALFARGEARVYLLTVGGVPRAALYGFQRGNRFEYYQSGNDPEWRQRSVGTVVLGAAIEDACRRGLVEMDFLRGNESYKLVFASGKRELVTLRFAAGARARLAWALAEGVKVGRQRVRDALPPSAVEWFRRTRRRLTRAPADVTANAPSSASPSSASQSSESSSSGSLSSVSTSSGKPSSVSSSEVSP